MQPDASHHAIHQVRRARHVAGVLQQSDEGKEHRDLRQKGQHRPHASEHAVDDQAADVAVRQLPADERASVLNAGLNKILNRRGPRKNRLEDQRHQHEKEHRAPDAMQGDGIDAIAHRACTVLPPRDRACDNARDPRVSRFRFKSTGYEPRVAHGACRRVDQDLQVGHIGDVRFEMIDTEETQ